MRSKWKFLLIFSGLNGNNITKNDLNNMFGNHLIIRLLQ